jgi:hypothetical protein
MKRIDLDKLDRIFPGAHFDLAFGCAEPGYDDKPVIMADWNHVPNVVFSRLESLGYACEWSDEWTPCSECGKAVRTSPDSYNWQPAYIIQDGDLLCLDCVDAQAYYESIENRPDVAASNEFTYKYPIEDYGYTRVNDDAYTNGLHPGQNDDPKQILGDLLSNDPEGRFVFTLDYTSQFEVGFSVYRKVV